MSRCLCLHRLLWNAKWNFLITAVWNDLQYTFKILSGFHPLHVDRYNDRTVHATKIDRIDRDLRSMRCHYTFHQVSLLVRYYKACLIHLLCNMVPVEYLRRHDHPWLFIFIISFCQPVNLLSHTVLHACTNSLKHHTLRSSPQTT